MFACSFPELAEKADVSDWIAAGHSADDLRERADAAPVWLPTEFVSAPITPLAGRHLISHRASDIQPERLQWVWPGRIARGKVALLGGPPGLGKSQVTASIAAIVSSGGTMVGLQMPRAIEILDATLRRLERGEMTALEAIDAQLRGVHPARDAA